MVIIGVVRSMVVLVREALMLITYEEIISMLGRVQNVMSIYFAKIINIRPIIDLKTAMER